MKRSTMAVRSAGQVRTAEANAPTPYGPARLVTFSVGRARPQANVVLGHGAGGGIDAPDLLAMAILLPHRGYAVTLVEQPWRVAGGRVAPAPRRLDACWLAALSAAESPAFPLCSRVPLVVGGRSAGARVACRTATALGAAGVVALAFPLHPPGKRDDPEKSRLPELLATGAPTVVVQGERDVFGAAAQLLAPGRSDAKADLRVVSVPYADHGFAVPRTAPVTQAQTLMRAADAVAAWLENLLRRE